MEEKRVKAGGVAIGICLLIIAILLVGMVLIFYKWNNDKVILQSKIIELENKINEESKKDDVLSKEKLEKLAEETLDKYVKLMAYEDYNDDPMPNIIKELGLQDEEKFDEWILDELGEDVNRIVKTNIKYHDFKNTLLEYITEEYFSRKFSHYINKDGYVGVTVVGRGISLMEVEEITLNTISENKYIFDVILKDVEVYEHYLNPEEGENITEEDYLLNYKFVFELVNDKLLVTEWKKQ